MVWSNKMISGDNKTLILKVTNSANIESGCQAYFIFDYNGGTLGSSKNNLWVIQDTKNNIQPDQARVEWRDNHYCFQVTGKNEVSINGSMINSRSGFIRLNKSDIITIGNIEIKVYIENEKDVDLKSLALEPVEIIGTQDHLKHLIGDKKQFSSPQNKTNNFLKEDKSLDPLSALSNDDPTVSSTGLLNNESPFTHSSATSSNIGRATMSSSNFIDLPQPEQHQKSEYIENAYVTISPLLREMDTKIPLNNSQDINDILSEIGSTLKATVDGLLRLQQAQSSLSDKHLRPIEDNPLRLNLDYPATMDILFGNQKSPVHLAAPAAVSECLNNLLIHNEANKMAIISALSAILQAFSPEMLLARFENYRRSNERQDMDPSWAWRMYENYYRELTSTRQQGFEKLFWEVYEQAYDKALREQGK